MSDQPLQPLTGRTGGGLSARVAAIAAIGVLAAFIWAGLSGREPGDEVSASPTPPLVVVARPSPAATEPVTEPEPASQPTPAARTAAPSPPASHPLPADSTPLVLPFRPGPLGEDAFAVALWLEGRFYMSVLGEESPGNLAAAMRLPLYSEMPTTTIQLIQLWTREDRPPLAEIADYEIDLAALRAEPAPDTLLEAGADPRPRRSKAPRLVREGYELHVTSDVRRDHAYLLVRVRIGGAPPVEAASDRLARITRGWYDYGRRDRLLVPGTGGSDEGRDLTLWSCNDQGLTWASRQDCGARPSSMSATPPHSRGSR
jgi:hypothetical protein